MRLVRGHEAVQAIGLVAGLGTGGAWTIVNAVALSIMIITSS